MTVGPLQQWLLELVTEVLDQCLGELVEAIDQNMTELDWALKQFTRVTVTNYL